MKILPLLLFIAAALPAQPIQGVVLDGVTGAPLEGAYISIYNGTQTVVRTDPAGRFSIQSQSLVPGQFRPISVLRAGYVEVPAVVPKPGNDVTIRLAPAASLSGKVEDEDGFPVEAARVELMQYRAIDGERRIVPIRWANTDDLGAYHIGGMAAGRSYLRVTSGNTFHWDNRYVAQYLGGTLQPNDGHVVELKAGEQHTTLVQLVRFEGVTVSGRVESPGSDPLPFLHLEGDRFDVATGSLQRDGTFVIRHVMPGRHKLIAGNSPPRAGELHGEMPLEVGSEDIAGVVLKIRTVAPFDLPGKIVVDGGGERNPMVISVRHNYGPGVSARPEPDGSFVLKGLLPGHYDIQVMPDFSATNDRISAMTYPLSIKLADDEVLRKGFDLDGPSPGPLTITVGKPIVVRAHVINAAGQPVPEVTVLLRSGAESGIGMSDAKGEVRIMLRFPGEYRVYTPPDQGSVYDPDYLNAHENDSPAVKVVRGDNPPLWVKLPAK
jgi:hypothetical protein